MATVQLSNLCKTFADGTSVVRGVDMSIRDGEFCVLLGPSGCGKSTTLRMIAGLERATSGSILIGGRDVTHVEPKDRDVAMVFQNYALYPHLTVADNIAFPLAMRGVDKATRAKRVREASQMLELDELLSRRPAQLSGGQRQRVAMARAIVRDPKVFLFDEPLSNLDARLRAQTRRELKSLHARVRITSVYVTHDQEEAMSLADRIAVMASGTIQQFGTPLELFRRPANRFVAGFVGTPAMNFLEARVESVGRVLVASVGGASVQVHASEPTGARMGDLLVLGFRPGALRVSPEPLPHADEHALAMDGVVESCDLLGESSDLVIRSGGHSLMARAKTHDWMRVGARCCVCVPEHEAYLFEPGPMGLRLLGGTTVADALPEPAIAGS